jgi:hypothetical protein
MDDFSDPIEICDATFERLMENSPRGYPVNQ